MIFLHKIFWDFLHGYFGMLSCMRYFGILFCMRYVGILFCMRYFGIFFCMIYFGMLADSLMLSPLKQS